MEATVLVRNSIESLYNMHNDGEMNDDYALQRDGGQWNRGQKNALIDSMLRNFVIPSIWVIVNDTPTDRTWTIIDGKQRTSTIFSFIDDEWKLAKTFEPVYYKGEFYDVAGKKFSELDKKIQTLILHYTLEVIQITNYDEEQLEEQFLRLNSGTSFKPTQKAKVALGTQIAPKFDEKILNLPFWDRCAPSIANSKTDAKLGVALECLMLLTDYETKSYGSPDIIKFAEYYKDNYKDSDLDELALLLNKLDEYYPADEECVSYLKKLHIPALVMCMKVFLNIQSGKLLFHNVAKCRFSEEEFEEWLYKWVTKTYQKEYTEKGCKEGTTKKTKVEARVNIICQTLINVVGDKMCDLVEEIKGDDFDWENGDYSFLNEIENESKEEEVETEIISDVDVTNVTDDITDNDSVVSDSDTVGDDNNVQTNGENGDERHEVVDRRDTDTRYL